jgi:hypothetical protein
LTYLSSQQSLLFHYLLRPGLKGQKTNVTAKIKNYEKVHYQPHYCIYSNTTDSSMQHVPESGERLGYVLDMAGEESLRISTVSLQKDKRSECGM